MKQFLIFYSIFSFAFFVGCNETNKQEVKNDTEKSEMTYPMESVMINKTQCNLYGEFKDLEIQDIVGIWTDSLFWKQQPNDSCYYGIDELDISVELEINPSKTFRLSTNYSKPEYNRLEMGEFFLDYKSGITTLVLATNPEGEKLFEQGDTMRNSVVYNLHWIDSQTIILDGKVEKDGYRLREGIEYKKKRPANRVDGFTPK